MIQGRFIVVEGPEGAGKSSVLTALRELVPPDKFVFTHEPGGTDYARDVGRRFLRERKQPTNAFEELTAVEGPRSHHVRYVIKPALEAGTHVICDRFSASTYAYQVYDRGEEQREEFYRLEQRSTYGLVPDFWIFLDVEPEVGLKRVAERNEKKTIFDEQGIEFHQRIRNGLSGFLMHRPHKRIDTTHLPLAEVVSQVRDIVFETCDLY